MSKRHKLLSRFRRLFSLIKAIEIAFPRPKTSYHDAWSSVQCHCRLISTPAAPQMNDCASIVSLHTLYIASHWLSCLRKTPLVLYPSLWLFIYLLQCLYATLSSLTNLKYDHVWLSHYNFSHQYSTPSACNLSNYIVFDYFDYRNNHFIEVSVCMSTPFPFRKFKIECHKSSLVQRHCLPYLAIWPCDERVLSRQRKWLGNWCDHIFVLLPPRFLRQVSFTDSDKSIESLVDLSMACRNPPNSKSYNTKCKNRRIFSLFTFASFDCPSNTSINNIVRNELNCMWTQKSIVFEMDWQNTSREAKNSHKAWKFDARYFYWYRNMSIQDFWPSQNRSMTHKLEWRIRKIAHDFIWVFATTKTSFNNRINDT